MRLREGLSMHKFTLLATLFLCSQRNNMQVREKQHTIEQSLLGLHDSTARQYQALATNLEKGVESVKKAYEQTNQELEDVAAPLTRIESGGEEQNDWHLHIMDVDVERLTISVLLTKETLRDTLFTMCSDGKQGNPTHEDANVIWSEMNQLLASSLEASTSLANRRSRFSSARPHNAPNSQIPHHHLSERTPPESNFRKRSGNGQGLGTQPFRRTRRTQYHLQMTPHGLLSIEMNCRVSDTGEHATSARVAFIPTTKSCRVGFIAQLSRSLQDATYPTLRRQLSTINILENEKSLTGDRGTVMENDIVASQRLLSGNIATPFDHVDNDTTILWVCPRRLWRRIQRMVDGSSNGSQFFQSSLDVITARCGSEVLSIIRGHHGSSETLVS